MKYLKLYSTELVRFCKKIKHSNMFKENFKHKILPTTFEVILSFRVAKSALSKPFLIATVFLL